MANSTTTTKKKEEKKVELLSEFQLNVVELMLAKHL